MHAVHLHEGLHQHAQHALLQPCGDQLDQPHHRRVQLHRTILLSTARTRLRRWLETHVHPAHLPRQQRVGRHHLLLAELAVLQQVRRAVEALPVHRELQQRRERLAALRQLRRVEPVFPELRCVLLETLHVVQQHRRLQQHTTLLLQALRTEHARTHRRHAARLRDHRAQRRVQRGERRHVLHHLLLVQQVFGTRRGVVAHRQHQRVDHVAQPRGVLLALVAELSHGAHLLLVRVRVLALHLLLFLLLLLVVLHVHLLLLLLLFFLAVAVALTIILTVALSTLHNPSPHPLVAHHALQLALHLLLLRRHVLLSQHVQRPERVPHQHAQLLRRVVHHARLQHVRRRALTTPHTPSKPPRARVPPVLRGAREHHGQQTLLLALLLLHHVRRQLLRECFLRQHPQVLHRRREPLRIPAVHQILHQGCLLRLVVLLLLLHVAVPVREPVRPALLRAAEIPPVSAHVEGAVLHQHHVRRAGVDQRRRGGVGVHELVSFLRLACHQRVVAELVALAHLLHHGDGRVLLVQQLEQQMQHRLVPAVRRQC